MENSKFDLVLDKADVNFCALAEELLECVAGGDGSTSIPVFIG
jgi:hypothetical protein